MKDYRAVVFDFDGVIKESVQVKAEAFVKLYEPFGADFQERVRTYHLNNGGVSRYKKFEVWNEWLGLPTTTEAMNKLAARFADLVLEGVIHSPFIPGALDAIETAHAKALSFIATGTPDGEINEILGRLELGDFFTEVHGSSRNKIEILSDILMRYNLVKEDVLFVGDAQTDYQAALHHGVDFYLRETDYNREWFGDKPAVKHRGEDLQRLVSIMK